MLYKIGDIITYTLPPEVPIKRPSKLLIRPSKSAKSSKRRLSLIRYATLDGIYRKVTSYVEKTYFEDELWVLPEYHL